MRSHLIKIFLVAVPVLTLIIGVEIQFRNIPNDYSYKSEYLKKHGEEINVLALGGSHNYRGINPDYFDKECFNAAMVSQSLKYDYFILEKHLSDLPHLEYIIIPISYPTLTMKLEETLEHWRKYRYIHYMNYNDLDLKDRFSLETYLAISHEDGLSILKNLYQYWYRGLDHRSCLDNGMGKSIDQEPVNLKNSAIEAAQRHEDSIFDVHTNMNDLNQIIGLCKNHNIKLILITPPGSSYYIKNLQRDNLELINRTCDSIAKEHPHVLYRNFIDDPVFRDSLFQDADHLNRLGAGILSVKLNEIIRNDGVKMATQNTSEAKHKNAF